MNLRPAVRPECPPLASPPPAEHPELDSESPPGREAHSSKLLLHQLFESRVRRCPDAVSVEFRGAQISYRRLDEQAKRLAHRLRGRGIAPENRVAIFLEPSVERVAALLAVLKAGGAWVPLDPAYPPERTRRILLDSGASQVITCGRLASALPETRAEILRVDLPGADRGPSSSGDLKPAASPDSPDHLAYLIYTSGSSGRPKGVEIPHRAVVAFLRSMRRAPGIGPGDRLLAVTTLCFDISILETFLPLSAGARLLLADRATATDGAALRERLERGDVTLMQATPSTWNLLIEAGWEGDARLVALAGGETLPGALARRLRGRCATVWNLYGPTETTIWSSRHRLTGAGERVPIGRPIDGTSLHLLDAQLAEAAPGEPAELQVAGDGLARGYHSRPAATAASFRPHPGGSRPGERLYATGDVARSLPDGSLDHLGRGDRQIKVRGHRVEPAEIEAVIRDHPAALDCAVVATEDPRGDPRLVAYVTRAAADPGGDAGARFEGWQRRQVGQWEQVWDEAWEAPRGEIDPDYRIAGWESSYTGLPIPRTEMREWVDGAVQRILALQPGRVLEIGCGTGLLLRHVAPACSLYRGTDVSRRALSFLRARLPDWNLGDVQVELEARAAHDLEGLEDDAFDTVIVNSVVQYFPSLEYLVRVLRGLVRITRPGGHVFLGDLRGLPWQEALRATVELHQAPASMTAEEIRRRARRRARHEEELLLDPAFCAGLAHPLPGVADCRLELKRGRHDNELTCFRFDLTLRVAGGDEPATGAAPVAERWRDASLDLATLRARLSAERPAALRLDGIPNARLSRALATVALLEPRRGGSPRTAENLRRKLAALPAGDGVAPEDVWDLARAASYEVTLRPSADAGNFDALFRHRDAEMRVCWEPDGAPVEEPSPLPAGRRANDPLLGRFAHFLETRMRRYVKERLPGYMVPELFVALDALPLTPNGKRDLAALPAPDWRQPQPDGAYVPPATPSEAILCELWAEVLGVDRVGIHDDFFRLGGHSLLAARLCHRITSATEHRPTSSLLAEAPTVQQLARALDRTASKIEKQSLIAIQPGGSRPPVFAVHAGAGTVLFYRDLARHLGLDQPFYGFQALGHDRVEAMAEAYVAEMRAFQPTGPYLLLGASFGGLVALEMAQQLRAAGERAALVALLDTWGPGYPEYLPSTTRLERALDDLSRRFLHHHLTNLWLLDPGERIRYLKAKARIARLRFAKRLRRWARWARGRWSSAQARSPRPDAEPDPILSALSSYRPRFYPERLTLLRASRQPKGIRPDPALGWAKLAADLEIHEYAGTHAINDPRVRGVAEKLMPCLRRAQRQVAASSEGEGSPGRGDTS